MPKFKVSSSGDNTNFVSTASYRKLSKKFQSLKIDKGRIIHVLGAPGTGKSTNIHRALGELNLNVFEFEFELSNDSMSSKEVFCEFLKSLEEQLGVNSKEESYKRLLDFDVVLFADKFHDIHYIEHGKVGFSMWTDTVGWRAAHFYILCIAEYIRHRRNFQDMNLVFQTAWRTYFRGKKYDIFTDLGVLSRIIRGFLKLLFEVVEISYSEEETIEIVKNHVDASEADIKDLIKKYGRKPRFICQELENN
ncbi:ATP-binding protein [Methanobacterium paludis]|uniref:AAA+ ATPase domain-containing protein n=1 Tax=Methanobacterium paludis (strain DSM 25820 / JCM 18151 / SWAN1) TaxID=868131 RepID=F6D6R3_METPW|nr:ATP-binding protein [Methanobacterium paludis]AEG18346.1 hypothetical protein MSWAN_1331 [Methanobacterium paludis]